MGSELNSRTLWDATGIRFYLFRDYLLKLSSLRFLILGSPLRFNPMALLSTLIIIYIFTTFAAYFVDFIVFFLLPGRKLYRTGK